MIKCKNCGFELPAATQMNEEAFMAINIENNNESCHKCKKNLCVQQIRLLLQRIWGGLTQ